MFSAQQLSDAQYAIYGRSLKNELNELKTFLSNFEKNLLKTIEYEITKANMFFKHSFNFNKYVQISDICMFSNICQFSYIFKYIKYKIIPRLKIFIVSFKYSVNIDIELNEIDKCICLKLKIYWKSRKLKNLVHSLIMFNRMYKEYLAAKYKFGSKISLEAEQRFNLKCHAEKII